MRYGFIIPDIQDAGPAEIAVLAREAEANGWDALFFWDGDWGLSPWVLLSAMAVQTERIRCRGVSHGSLRATALRWTSFRTAAWSSRSASVRSMRRI